MRSLLLVAADSDENLARAAATGADALILDLAGAGEPARQRAALFLAEHGAGSTHLYVRIHALDGGLADADLDAVVPARPAGIVLPKASGGSDAMRLSATLAAREAFAGIDDGATKIIAVVETPAALFNLGTYAGASARLAALIWDAEGLAAALGAAAPRDDKGRLGDACRLARSLCLAAAAAANAVAIDTAFARLDDPAGFAAEALAARRDGFAGKLAIDARQVPVINEVFASRPAPSSR
jgi:citrate lyase subunit beta/citryl-CoA lyase